MSRLSATAAALAVAASSSTACEASPIVRGWGETAVAPTPPLGWSSWNYWGCNINATILMESAGGSLGSVGGGGGRCVS